MNVIAVCSSCGTTFEEHVDACPECSQEFCPECFGPIAEDATSCNSCGAEFDILCPRCDEELHPSAVVCPKCGLAFEELEEATGTLDDESLRPCPICMTPLFLEDGFCRECGQTICTNCGQQTAEEDERCPNCDLLLYFDCPLCGFELMAGCELCPNCDAFFPDQCPNCQAAVNPGEERCRACRQRVPVRQRRSARTVQTMVIGEQVVRLVACPGCGRNFDPLEQFCANCGLRLCPQCQMILAEDEVGCPRCGR